MVKQLNFNHHDSDILIKYKIRKCIDPVEVVMSSQFTFFSFAKK